MKVEINGTHNIDNRDIARYIRKKIGKLDTYISRHARKTAHAEVNIKEVKIKDKREYSCEVILHVPNEVITAKESTVNIFAAVDIVEEKLKSQLRKYKEKHKGNRRNPIKDLLRRIRSGVE